MNMGSQHRRFKLFKKPGLQLDADEGDWVASQSLARDDTAGASRQHKCPRGDDLAAEAQILSADAVATGMLPDLQAATVALATPEIRRLAQAELIASW